jgi:hypothetical protein
LGPDRGKRKEDDKVRKVDMVIAASSDDRRNRWRSAMLKVWPVGDILVGVSTSLDVSVLTVQDSTTVPDPHALANALTSAEAFALAAAYTTVTRALRA